MRDSHTIIRARTQKPPADKIDFLSNLKKNMWISEEVDRQLREYIITQMLNLLRFLLAVNNITDSGTKTFAEVCDDKRNIFLQTYDSHPYIPNFKCLWDNIFNLVYIDPYGSFTPILSAYSRSNKIETKKELYVKMSSELEKWANTIKRIEEICIFAIGMTKKHNIWESLTIHNKYFNKDARMKNFYRDSLDLLINNNFDNIDLESFEIKPIEPIQTKYEDPLQQVFYKYIILSLRERQMDLHVRMTPDDICTVLSKIILFRFRISINIPIMDENIQFNNIDQIIEYLESKIPPYPAEIKGHLSILTAINGFLFIYNKSTMIKLARLSELSNYNLINLPVGAIIHGCCGATPLEDIPLEQIPEYYARLTHNYSGTHTKAAKRDLAF